MAKKKPPAKRNPQAQSLQSALFQKRVIRNKKRKAAQAACRQKEPPNRGSYFIFQRDKFLPFVSKRASRQPDEISKNPIFGRFHRAGATPTAVRHFPYISQKIQGQ